MARFRVKAKQGEPCTNYRISKSLQQELALRQLQNHPYLHLRKAFFFAVYCEVMQWVFSGFRVVFTGFALLVLLSPVQAQVGNEWINDQQIYFKIPVAQNGLYRVTQTQLEAAGFPVHLDPRNLQLFHRGTEQAIHVEGESDGVFDPADYLEFYGIKNDGTTDTELYQPTTVQPHTYYNLFSDTTWYFLTWNAGASGKRMEQRWENNVGLPAETSHLQDHVQAFGDHYTYGKAHGTPPNNFIYNTFYDVGEGWSGFLLWQNEHLDHTLENLNDGVPADGPPVLEVQAVGRVDLANVVEIYVGPTAASLRFLVAQNLSGFIPETIVQPLNWTDIGADGKMVVRVMAKSASGGAARLSASYIRVRFPQNFNAATERFYFLTPNPGGKSYAEFTSAPAGAQLYDVTDRSNVIWYRPPVPGSLQPVISSTTGGRTLLVTASVKTPTVIKQVSFRKIYPAEHKYIIISHPLLRQPAGNYADPVKAYADYRASAAGGGFDTLLMEIEQLYDQFNYGEISSLAIRRFMKFMIDGGNPEYLFIIGKGLDVSWNYHRNPNDPAFAVHKDLVPSAGVPASDMHFTIGLGSTTYEPAVPTGRISATSASQVAAYLDKVMEMEAQPFNDLWRKRLIHLSGGIAPGETTLFRQYLEAFELVAEDEFLGGSVKAQAKNTTDVGELINISEEVNNGLNMITFFGHSSPATNDFEIGFVSNPVLGYNNAGKYPVLLINGCNSADFFTTTLRWGEDWVLAANKGATAFIAHTSFGYTSTLRKYSDTFYNVAYADSSYLSRGLGDVQKEVARAYMLTSSPTDLNLTQISQMLLLGDPAVRLFGAPRPDYEVNSGSIEILSLDGQPITALTDAFDLRFVVRNFGRAIRDSVIIQLTRINPDNSIEVTDSLFAPVLYSDTLAFRVNQSGSQSFGNTVFRITIDPYDFKEEITRDNNQAERTIFIPLNAARHLFPYNFAIVNSPSASLTFSSTDVLGTARDFDVELDTVHTFDSPYLKTFVATGAVATQAVTLLTQDSLAYYWRTRFRTPQPGESNEWVTSSFNYIHASPEGWAQLHFPQYQYNPAEGLVADPAVRLLSFKESVISVDIHTFGSSHPAPHTSVSVNINGQEYNPPGVGVQCRDNTINLIAFNKNSTIPYTAVEFNPFVGKACGRRPQVINSFLSSELQTGLNNDIFQYMLNVPAGDSVVVFSIGDPGYASWSAAVKGQFELIGISTAQLNSLAPGEPVIFFGKKGATPGSAFMFRPASSPVNQQELDAGGTITGRFDSGTMSTGLIGPAEAWGSFVMHTVVSETPVTDVFAYDILGVSLTGTEEVLFEDVTGSLDLSGISAVQYPYLKIEYYASDPVNLTPSQINHWIVTFTPVAEGVLVSDHAVEQVNVLEGQPWTDTFGFRNISQKSFSDSLTVQTNVFNESNGSTYPYVQKIKAPAPGETTWFSVGVNTQNKVGSNDISIDVNPRRLPELYYDNNRLELADHIQVTPDIIGPVLEVSVDGRVLVDGDFVSATPVIEITQHDDNAYLLKTDTLGMTLLLLYPGETFPRTFYFSSPHVAWFPQTAQSDYRIVLTPDELPAGMYTLYVNGSDARGNSSGAEPYAITFQVSNTSLVQVKPAYPNPFTTSVTFDVVIAGDILPDYAQLDILRSNGQAVQSFIYTEFFVGTNRLFWNGTDASGNALPGGLYLCRLRIFKNGQLMKTDTAAGVANGSYSKVIRAR
jgi:hypothetical protein